MRLVAGLVKGLPVERALNILNFTPKIAAHHIAKTVKSAAANALSSEGTDRLKPESLVVSRIVVDAAPTAKRIRFQSMGRAFRYRKRYSHLTVVLEGETDVAPKSKRRAAKPKKKEAEVSAKAAEMKTTTEEVAADKTTDKAAVKEEEK